MRHRPIAGLGRQLAVALRQPAMTEHIKMEGGSAVQVSFKSKSFFLLVPDADKPLEGDGPGPQADGHPGIVEPVRGKAEAGVKLGHAQPTGVQHMAFAGTRGLHPAQGGGTLAAVIARKIEKPHPQQDDRTKRVNEHHASHKGLNADTTTCDASTATGSSAPDGVRPQTVLADQRPQCPIDHRLPRLQSIRGICLYETSGTRNSRPCGALTSSVLPGDFLQPPGTGHISAAARRICPGGGLIRSQPLRRWQGLRIKPDSSAVGFIVAEAGSRGPVTSSPSMFCPAPRSGIGSQLLHAAEERLRAAGCHSVILETAVDNPAAVSFYKRHHYSVIKTLPRYYSNGVDAFVLKKDLLSPAAPAKLPQESPVQNERLRFRERRVRSATKLPGAWFRAAKSCPARARSRFLIACSGVRWRRR